MKVAFTGHKGLVGSYLLKKGHYPLLSDFASSVADFTVELNKIKPDVIIHAGAKTGVDWCEANYNLALLNNSKGTANIARICKDRGIRLIYLSTDHVFDGRRVFLGYQESDQPNPINAYGFSKYGGEIQALTLNPSKTLVVRSSKIFSEETIQDDYNKYMKEIEEKGKVYIPSFIVRSFHYLPFFYENLMHVIENEPTDRKGNFTKRRIINISSRYIVSHFSLWDYILQKYGGLPSECIQKRTKEIDGLGAKRPKRCGLRVNKLESIGAKIYTTEEGLEECFKSIKL